MGPTAEHTQSVARTGRIIVPLEELYVAHRLCQNRQGGRRAKPKGGKPPEAPVHPERRLPVAIKRIGVKVPPFVAGDAPPRLLSPSHPNAVGSLATEWLDTLEGMFKFSARPWQRLVLERALEVDAQGQLCWREVVVSTPRQSGKSYLIYALCMARATFAKSLGEPQEIIHIANNLAAARRIQQLGWGYADNRTRKVSKSIGQERIAWSDGSVWALVAASAVWGWSAHMALVDEGWDVKLESVDSAIKPTLVERAQSQLWMLSTANAECTDLMPSYRLRAGVEKGILVNPSTRTMIAEWSAQPGADPMDPKVWQSAAPAWSPGRLELMASSVGSTGFEEQWLNMWPGIPAEEAWAASWPRLPEGMPSGTLIGAVETAYDRSCYGVAVASPNVIDAAVCYSEQEALDWLNEKRPAILMAGSSISQRFQGPWVLKPVGARETHSATPWFAGAIRTGQLSHTHDPIAGSQIAGAAATTSESGPVISARRSSGPIPAAKAAAWAGAAASEDWYGLSQAIAIW